MLAGRFEEGGANDSFASFIFDMLLIFIPEIAYGTEHGIRGCLPKTA